ncbi:MAG: hypothetical protein GYA15_06670 [Leptolinea sp.]|jgi:hypothetical protein|nr:hypothetical protein [Leptolinea sp.]
MSIFSVNDIFLAMAVFLFIIGIFSIASGIFVLVAKIAGGDLRTIARQTTALAQKGLTEEISGLVGNATALIVAINDLVKTASGIGVFLIMVGIVAIGVALGILTQL